MVLTFAIAVKAASKSPTLRDTGAALAAAGADPAVVGSARVGVVVVAAVEVAVELLHAEATIANTATAARILVGFLTSSLL
jgi:hypothetical protein